MFVLHVCKPESQLAANYVDISIVFSAVEAKEECGITCYILSWTMPHPCSDGAEQVWLQIKMLV